MFELYDIFDSNEINIIILVIFIIILLIIVIALAVYDYRMKQKLIRVETKLKDITDALDMNINNNYTSDISNSNKANSNNSYKDKYEELLKEKDIKDSHPMQYSPSEYATLLKYNPILPYSAFTMDIINNSYLDMNERGMQEDRYFALSNYDNIYDTTRNNNNNNNNSVSDTGATSDEQELIDMAEMGEIRRDDNPTLNSNNSTAVQPKTTSMNDNF
uniref:Uncharacterized protein n=1 Tax=viral metagenome TaxID=1070528 RepID=A0A6C0C4Z1_9ZZZZ